MAQMEHRRQPLNEEDSRTVEFHQQVHRSEKKSGEVL